MLSGAVRFALTRMSHGIVVKARWLCSHVGTGRCERLVSVSDTVILWFPYGNLTSPRIGTTSGHACARSKGQSATDPRSTGSDPICLRSKAGWSASGWPGRYLAHGTAPVCFDYLLSAAGARPSTEGSTRKRRGLPCSVASCESVSLITGPSLRSKSCEVNLQLNATCIPS
jgi:hypothetical protein